MNEFNTKQISRMLGMSTVTISEYARSKLNKWFGHGRKSKFNKEELMEIKIMGLLSQNGFNPRSEYYLEDLSLKDPMFKIIINKAKVLEELEAQILKEEHRYESS